MKIAITGHSKGIGKALADEFEKHGHEVIGYSRSNGWSIKENKLDIIEDVKKQDFDIFINNAYVHKHQTELLMLMVQEWLQCPDKLIVNLNSKVIFHEPKHLPPDMVLYRKDKIDQNNFIKSGIKEYCPKVLDVVLGFTDTEMGERYQGQKINTKDLAELLNSVISMRDKIFTQQIVLDATSR